MKKKKVDSKKKYVKPAVEHISMDAKNLIKGCLVCPHLFVWDGVSYIKENSILPDSEDISRKERDLKDYYVLRTLPVPKDGHLNFKIRELANDVSYLKRVSLLTVEHPQETSIGVSREGEIYSYNKDSFILPQKCIDKNGNKIPQIAEFDTTSFYQATPGDCLYLEIEKPNSSQAKLIILDPPVEEYKRYAGGPNEPPPISKTSIHIFLFMKNKWRYITTLHTRTDFYVDIVNLAPYLSDTESRLKIKLEFTAFHQVAFIGLDVTPSVNVKKKEYKLVKAIHSRLENVTEILERDEGYVKLSQQEEIELNFPIPQPAESWNQISYILVTEGYYIPTTKILYSSLTTANC
jgi:hypothetical protein